MSARRVEEWLEIRDASNGQASVEPHLSEVAIAPEHVYAYVAGFNRAREAQGETEPGEHQH